MDKVQLKSWPTSQGWLDGYIEEKYTYTYGNQVNSLWIDRFINILNVYAYFLNKGWSWQPENLPETCPT